MTKATVQIEATANARSSPPGTATPATAIPSSTKFETTFLGRLIIISRTDDSRTEVFLTDAECARLSQGCTKNWHQITNTPKPQLPLGGEPIDIQHLAVSPNGEMLAFSFQPANSPEDENWDVYVIDIEKCLGIPDGCTSADFIRLTSAPGDDVMPAWSPDGAAIAFVSNRSGFLELYTMNVDGSNQVKISEDKSVAHLFPAWSPNGRQLVFGLVTQARDAGPKLYSVNRDGSELMQLSGLPVDSSVGDQDPHWSPDGQLLAFRSTRNGLSNIFLLHTDDGSISRLIATQGASHPYWSPDGNKIIYLAQGEQPYEYVELWIANRDGQDSYQLTSLGYIDDVVWASR